MRKLNKRFLALLLVAVLAIGTVMNAWADGASDEESDSSTEATGEEFTSTAWWSGVSGAEVALSSTETTVVYTVEVASDITDWGLEVYDSDLQYITVISLGTV